MFWGFSNAGSLTNSSDKTTGGVRNLFTQRHGASILNPTPQISLSAAIERIEPKGQGVVGICGTRRVRRTSARASSAGGPKPEAHDRLDVYREADIRRPARSVQAGGLCGWPVGASPSAKAWRMTIGSSVGKAKAVTRTNRLEQRFRETRGGVGD
jgi:hypothetical protein